MSELLKDIDDLPEELKKELSYFRGPAKKAKRTSKRHVAIVELMLQCEKSPSYDELLVHIYKKTNAILTKEKLQQTLHTMRKKGWVMGTRQQITLCTDNPDVAAIRQQLGLHEDEKPGAGTAAGKKSSKKKGCRVSGGTPPIATQPGQQTGTRNNRTITCANCTAVKSLKANDKHITWKELEFCSFRCKRELVDALEET